MKRIANALSVTLLVLLFVLAGQSAKAEYSPQFGALDFQEADGFYTVIVDLSGAEYRFDGILDISALEQCPGILEMSSYRIYYGDTAVMDVVLRELEIKATDPDITSADGIQLTNGYYAATFDIDEEYEAFLTGLTLDNLQEVQLELIRAIVSGTGFNLEHLAFIDTEKRPSSLNEDVNLCWAAACSNILHYTGWAQAADAGLDTPDDVFEVYIAAFDDQGGNAFYGIPWFFSGINAMHGESGWAQVDDTETYTYGEFNGLLPEYAVDNFVKNFSVKTEPKNIEKTFAALRSGSGSTISFGWYTGSWTRGGGGHAISLWGYIQKKSASGFDKKDYYALIVSDSDSDRTYDERRDAPNELWMLTLTPMSGGGLDSWLLNGYNSSYYAVLEAFTVLEPYSDGHPKETAESADKFDGVATDIIPYIGTIASDVESNVFFVGDNITLRYGAWNATEFDWSGSRVVTLSYTLTDGKGETITSYTANASLSLSAGHAQFAKITVNLSAGEYILTVNVSLADTSYTETYYSNNTASHRFTVLAAPELTLSASVEEDSDELAASIVVNDASVLAYYDLFELSVSYLQDGVWSGWTTVYTGTAPPTSCGIEDLGAQVKFRLEAECEGVVSNSWESEPVSLERVSTHTLEDGGDLQALLASDAVEDGDTITLLGTANVNDTNSDSSPWIIDKAVTITGGTIDLRAGGILLGADVTFDGVTLSFGNRVRNAILVNGHTLTLKDVLQSSSANVVHLFCGGLTGHSVTAESGTHGKIIIMGSTALGNIYAGSMSSDGESNSLSLPVTITVAEGANGSTGVLYACGALETYVDPDEMLNPDYVVAAPEADAEAFAVTGAVNISLYQRVIKTVDGATGGNSNAIVTFNGTGDLCELTLTNLGGLAVQSGYLVPGDSSIAEGGDVSIASDARLDLTGFGDAVTVRNFTGGGELVLGESQTLTITGSVSGTTNVGIGGIFNNASEGTIDNEHTYIIAENSADESFVLLPPQNDTAVVFVRDEDGNWTIPAVSVAIVIESVSAPETDTLESGSLSLRVPITVSYVSDITYSTLCAVPLEIEVNGVSGELCEDEWGYYYTFPESSGLGETAIYYQDETTERLEIFAFDDGAIPDGKYTIVITIPGEYMESGEDTTLVTVVTVGEPEPEPDPDVVASGTCGENLTWVLTSDGTLTISGEGLMTDWYNDSEDYAPWYDHKDGIKTVVIGDGVSSVGSDAFEKCGALTNVALPNSITDIGNSAFSHCSVLTEILIPDSVTIIDSYAFSGCESLTSIVIPDSVQTIGMAAFSGCTSIVDVQIGGGVINIMFQAFTNCKSLTEFRVSEQNTCYSSIDGVLFDKTATKLIRHPIGKTGGTYVIPDSVVTIDKYAFQDCSQLVGVKFGENLTSILGGAFHNCTGLGSISIPDSVTSLGGSSFEGCTNLMTAHLGNGVTSIEGHAFSGCTALTTVTMGTGVSTVQGLAFHGCTALTTVVYGGNADDWENVTIMYGNDPLKKAKLICTGATDVSIEDSASGVPVLTWEALPGAEKYEIWRMTGSGTFELVAETTETEFCDQNAAPGEVYFYTIRAVCDGITSDFSDVVVYFKMRRGPLGVKPK